MRVEVSRDAAEDLREIVAYIAKDNLDAALAVEDAICLKYRRLGETPFMGQAADELRPGARVLFHGNYVIIYRINDGEVQITRLIHRKRYILAIMRGKS